MRNHFRRRTRDQTELRSYKREAKPSPSSPARRSPLSPAVATLLILIGGFASLVLTGTLLLLLPFASSAYGSTSLTTALFTATSAACVTGLVVVDSAVYWTGFGQAVLVALMFLGGLGIITAGAIVLLAIGQRLTLSSRLILREPMGALSISSVSRLGRNVFLFAVATQAVGTLMLFLRFLPSFSPGAAAWQALFQSVSAFNNAGLVILTDSDSLTEYRHDHLLIWVTALLILLGSISFSVLADLARRQRPNRMRLDTWLVLMGTAFLWGAGGAAMLLFEFANPATLGNLPLTERVSSAAFQGLASRTSGFSTIDFGATRSATDVVYMVLMFIGGASASTAGGIKINTAMVLLVASWASLRGYPRAQAFRREIPYAQVSRALAVLVSAVLTLLGVVMALAIAEDGQLRSAQFDFLDLLFEAFSALGTTGLSRGITPELTDAGKVIITIAMYLGRLGPLTVALGLALREQKAIYRYSEERVRIG